MMAKLSEIFDIKYGNSFALNTLKQVEKGIAFVSRTSKNNGVSAIVELVDGVEPFEDGLITVALSSMSVLEANVQPYGFYTGYHVAALAPKKNNMTLNEKLYYCLCIKKNKYKYYFGRQANRTLGDINVPEEAPDWVFKKNINSYEDITLSYNKGILLTLNVKNWGSFRINQLFNVVTGKGPLLRTAKGKKGSTPLVSATQFNNGIVASTTDQPTHEGNVLTLAKNGSVGEVFYQREDFTATSDILVLEPKFPFNVYLAMFFIPIIKKERHRYNYGRKWNKELLEASIIRLPQKNNKPDFGFMEEYIKTLKFSKCLE